MALQRLGRTYYWCLVSTLWTAHDELSRAGNCPADLRRGCTSMTTGSAKDLPNCFLDSERERERDVMAHCLCSYYFNSQSIGAQFFLLCATNKLPKNCRIPVRREAVKFTHLQQKTLTSSGLMNHRYQVP